MNWDTIEGNWKQVKGQFQQKWGKLTDDDLQHAKGRREEIVGKIQAHYGQAREDVEKTVDHFVSKI